MSTLPKVMSGIVLTGHGGLENLVWRDDLPVPTPQADEVLIKVAAAAVNNTDINTRIGWYSKSVTSATDAADTPTSDDGSWTGKPLQFPLVQGADCCGHIIAQGGGKTDRLGERVLVRPMQNWDGKATYTFGSEMNGGFAQYAIARSIDAAKVDCDWSDEELASIPCATTTAEGMLQRANLGAERVLITGASGGVGSAAVQLAKRRGAHVTAVTTLAKAEELRTLGADAIVERNDPFGQDAFDVVVDLVAGPRWPELLEAICPGGRYVASGAIAGPIVELDVRTLYLKDLTLIGSTKQPDRILTDVISYIEAGEIRPHIGARFSLRDIRSAQEAFLSKKHTGKIVLSVEH